MRQPRKQVIACHCRQGRRTVGYDLAAGAFDSEPDFELAVHIWTGEASDYDRVADDLPCYTGAAGNGIGVVRAAVEFPVC